MWLFKKKEQKPFHEVFPEIFQWEIGDNIHVDMSPESVVFHGFTDDGIMFLSVGLLEIKFSNLKLKKLKNRSLQQRRLKDKMNNSTYNQFINQCREEYQRLLLTSEPYLRGNKLKITDMTII